MARRRDPVMDEMRAIKRRLNARLYKAHQEGKLQEEVRRLCREGRQARRAAMNGQANGHKSGKR